MFLINQIGFHILSFVIKFDRWIEKLTKHLSLLALWVQWVASNQILVLILVLSCKINSTAISIVSVTGMLVKKLQTSYETRK